MNPAHLEGVLPVDKPVGPTSHDVVAAARRALQERRIGHTGTLDPFASGLMLLCVGSATRVAEFLTGLDKTYDATAVLGITTDSGDRDGEVTATSNAWRDLTPEALEAAAEGLRGTLLQRPPALSAKKIAGVPAHRRVRRGEDVVLDPREVTVYALDILSFQPPEVLFRVRCSSGTYVRSLARDLGDALGVGGHLTALRRTAVQAFTVDGALTLDALGDPRRVEEALLTPLEAVGHLPRLDVDAAAAGNLSHGRAVEAPDLDDGDPVVAAEGGRLVALGRVRDRVFRPRKVFPA